MGKHWLIAILSLLLASASVRAAILDYKPLAMPVEANDTLVVRGLDGEVRISPTKAKQLVVKVRQDNPDSAASIVRQSLDEWNFSLQRTGSQIELMVQSPASKDLWRHLLRSGGAPKFTLEITAPAIPLDVSWRSGKVLVEDWNAPMRVTLQEGLVQVGSGQGDVRIYGQSTDIRVRNRVGRVVAESYRGKVLLENIKGPVDVESFAGELQLTACEGPQEVRAHKSQIQINGGRGRLEFDIGRSTLKVPSFNGDFKGTADDGSVTAKVTEANEVRVNSKSGSIQLELPNSGASLNVATNEGSIAGPSHLRVEQQGSQRVLRGRLKGKTEGSVVIRSQSGVIRIR